MVRTLWVARDRSGQLFMYNLKPKKRKIVGIFTPGHCKMIDDLYNRCLELPESYFPNVTWENSPLKVQSIIADHCFIGLYI